ncbi:uncharacterized protein LOC116804941 [Drosophila grimshawi]|uniref:uncharacterized protein LOC116804941 n=1 Tax=Drosophila grimshawi TaxID=7222 RepID=UPI0013EEFEC0|nr:uncharacterized protein LOC116804941 [Drosophila grimshawi]
MEEVNTEIETTLAAVTSKAKVLAIGDGERCDKSKNNAVKDNDTKNFMADCLNHVSRLLLSGLTPIEARRDWPWEVLEIKFIREDNQLKRCHFHCYRSRKYLHDYCTDLKHVCIYNAELGLHEIRKRLKSENWISRYVLELPLKTKLDPEIYGTGETAIWGVCNSVVSDNRNDVFRFLHFLHKQYVEEKAKK